jgi:hypothetical protein
MAMSLVFHLAAQCMTVRNGNMTASFREFQRLAPGTWRSSATFWKAMRECLDTGFVEKTTASAGRPHTYRLGFVDLGVPMQPGGSAWPIYGWKPRARPAATPTAGGRIHGR